MFVIFFSHRAPPSLNILRWNTMLKWITRLMENIRKYTECFSQAIPRCRLVTCDPGYECHNDCTTVQGYRCVGKWIHGLKPCFASYLHCESLLIGTLYLRWHAEAKRNWSLLSKPRSLLSSLWRSYYFCKSCKNWPYPGVHDCINRQFINSYRSDERFIIIFRYRWMSQQSLSKWRNLLK